jgi:hypothetical protein
MSAWSHLPNARHIDWVIASLKKHPDLWSGGRDAPCKATRDAALDVAQSAARDAVRGAAQSAAWSAAWNAAWCEALAATYDANRYAAWNAACNAAQGVILALIAYDDCDQYLNMTSEELKVWAILSEHPAAILLLPAVVAFEQIRELESV